MNNELNSIWAGFSASIIGSGHIKRGLPCQDASAAVTSPRPALIVCDGRGSASRSQDGASAAVRDFTSQCAIFEPMLAAILDADEADAGHWEQFCRILYRTLMQTKLNLACEQNVPEKEFDFTVAAAVVGTNWIGCFQVGDGAIVLRQDGIARTAFTPDKGEFANQTHFLRENGEARGRFHAKLFSAKENSGIAITSDGPEHLMFRLATMTPGKIFHMLFDDMQNRSLTKQDIMDYLTRREWDKDPRGQDDRSIAILAPELAEQGFEPEPEFVQQEAVPEPEAIQQEAVPEPETIQQEAVPEPEAIQQEAVPESEATKQEVAPKPRDEEEKNAEGLTGEASAAPHDEAGKREDSPTPGSTSPDVPADEPHNSAERNSSAEPERVSKTDYRYMLISSGITVAAIIALLLSNNYYQSEINAMQRMLETAIAQQATIIPQHVDVTDIEELPQNVDATGVEELPQNVEFTVSENVPQHVDVTVAGNIPQDIDATDIEELPQHVDTADAPVNFR